MKRLMKKNEKSKRRLFTHVRAETLRALQDIHNRQMSIDNMAVTIRNWDQICDTIDRLCLILYLTVFTVGTFVIFVAL